MNKIKILLIHDRFKFRYYSKFDHLVFNHEKTRLICEVVCQNYLIYKPIDFSFYSNLESLLESHPLTTF